MQYNDKINLDEISFKKCNPNDILCQETKMKNQTIGYMKDEDKIITNTNPLKSNKNQTNKNVPFWTNDPNILLNKQYLLEFFPTNNMSYERKLNSISRLIVVITIISFIFTRNLRVLFVSALTLLCIYILYNYHSQNIYKREHLKNMEGFDTTDNTFIDDPTTLNKSLIENTINENRPEQKINDTTVFDMPKSNNPLSNVLMTDYDYNPDKKPAAPSYNHDINDEILEKTKSFVAYANPTQEDITDKLYKDLGDEMVFEQSMRQFYSNPSSTIPNDQNSFSEFCYGGMISCKEGNMFACAKNLSRYTF